MFRTDPKRLGAVAAAAALALVGVGPGAAMAAGTSAEGSPDSSRAAAADAASAKTTSAGQSAEDLSGDRTPEDLVESLVGGGVTYSNVTYTGADQGAGIVTGMDAIGIAEGVALSSGSVAMSDLGPSSILGPNELDSASSELGVDGDADLDAIVSPNATNDASVLEFDFVPDTDQVTFTYAFGSEEYNEYVGSSYNDVFGFFVNGQNCAVIDADDGEAPVTVNSINNDVNSSLYNDNEDSSGEGSPHDTELDGFTDPLVCAAPVTAGETNHVKLAIADTTDTIFDSSVVISAGTFQANSAPIAEDSTYTTTIDTPVDTPLVATDPDGDALTYTVVDEPETGTLSGDAPELTYTPAEGFEGEETFTFVANDGAEDSDTGTVTVIVEDGTTEAPTDAPTQEPTQEPSAEPTQEPTAAPTAEPSADPTGPPGDEPSDPADDPQPGEDLPRTGSDVGVAVTAAAILTAAGGALMFLARRRKLQH